MNKKRSVLLLCIIFVLQLLIPIGMVSYAQYIEWGMENRASVYKVELSAVEWLHFSSINLTFDFDYYRHDGVYCAIRTGADGFAELEITDKKPQGNYIKSNIDRYFYMPTAVIRYELQEQFSGDSYRWLYFMPEKYKEDWGWPQAESYFQTAYAEVHVFKGHAKTTAVYIDDRPIEDCIQEYIEKDIRME